MDQERFDQLAKRLAAGTTRRGLLKSLTGSAIGGVIAAAGLGRATAKGGKVNICHHNDLGTWDYITVDKSSLAKHEAHGDVVTNLTDLANCGACGNACPASTDQCLVAACVDGACAFVPKTDGTACSDGNACTQADTCQSGVCVGGNPVVCTASDACHTAGVCDPATGLCTGGNPVVCKALDACHLPGICDPATGICSNPPAPTGTVCRSATCLSHGFIDSADICDGAGTCVRGETISCFPYLCSGSRFPTCLTTCIADGDCASNHHCVDGACLRD